MEELIENIKACRKFLDDPDEKNVDFKLLNEVLKNAETELSRITELEGELEKSKDAEKQLELYRKTVKEDITGKAAAMGKEIHIEALGDEGLMSLKLEIEKEFDKKFKVISAADIETVSSKDENLEKYKI